MRENQGSGLADITQQNCSAECEGGRKVMWKPSCYTQELPGWFIWLSFTASCVRLSEQMHCWRCPNLCGSHFPLSSMQLSRPKNLADAVCGITKGALGRRTQTDAAVASACWRRWAGSLLPPTTCRRVTGLFWVLSLTGLSPALDGGWHLIRVFQETIFSNLVKHTEMHDEEISQICWIYFSHCSSGKRPLCRKHLKRVEKQSGRRLYKPSGNRIQITTSQIFYCQLSEAVTAWGPLTLHVCHHPVAAASVNSRIRQSGRTATNVLSHLLFFPHLI